MVEHTQTIRRFLLLTTCSSVFDHFVGLAPKFLRNLSVTATLFSGHLFPFYTTFKPFDPNPGRREKTN